MANETCIECFERRPCSCDEFDLDGPERDRCGSGGGPHLWTDTGGGVEVCEFCGDERPAA